MAPDRDRAELVLDVVSDVICPWCYIGKRRLARAAELLAPDLTIATRWRPFELNPDMPKAGMNRRQYRTRKFGSWERELVARARIQSIIDIGARRMDQGRAALLGDAAFVVRPHTAAAAAKPAADATALARALRSFGGEIEQALESWSAQQVAYRQSLLT